MPGRRTVVGIAPWCVRKQRWKFGKKWLLYEKLGQNQVLEELLCELCYAVARVVLSLARAEGAEKTVEIAKAVLQLAPFSSFGRIV